MLSTGGLSGCSDQRQGYTGDRSRIIANPLNLNYRFQDGAPAQTFMADERPCREAADPVLEYFKGKYYLFASKSGGYWSSDDLVKWTYIPCNSLPVIDDYAPTIVVYHDSLYFMASGGLPRRIFRTDNPEEDRWEEIDTRFEYGGTDPAFFLDDDGRMYIYWGCSTTDPIVGVEVDPQNGFQALSKPDTLIHHHFEQYGWEMPDSGRKANKQGFNEGPSMLKYEGKYYLQYASPGTEFRIYSDGVYVSDRPLGPFTYVESNPFSIKPGGFIAGAGHGHTFKDKYGNYWHVATMKISVRHMFERRLGLFPVYMKEGNMYAQTVFTDYPFAVPDQKVDFAAEDGWTGWNLLSYGKTVTASSALEGYDPSRANDEQVETWWAATTGEAGEWWQVDLGREMQVEAMQVNFADKDFVNTPQDSYVSYAYRIEGSDDGLSWRELVDRSDNQKDMPHELIVLDTGVRTRYLRMTNLRAMDGKFSLSGFRVFGDGLGDKADRVRNLTAERDSEDGRHLRVAWEACPEATGYILRWGIAPDRLYSAMMVYTNQYESRIFNRDSEYYFRVDTFNENGVTPGMETIRVSVP